MSRKIAADKAKIITKLQRMPIVEIACKQAGVPRSTYYRWRKDDTAFADKCDEAISLSVESINDLAESQLIAAIKDKNTTAITFWLKHRHKAYRSRVEISAGSDKPQDVLTPEQAETVNKALALAGLGGEGEKSETK